MAASQIAALDAAPAPARSARREGSPYPKAGLLARGVARATDLVLSAALSSFFTLSSRDENAGFAAAGVAAGLLYLAVADALWQGQSVGKRLAGLKVVYVPTRTPVGLWQSVVRNSPFCLVFLFYAIPIVGWLLLPIVGLPLIAFEGYMVYTDSLGIRIGDVFADTQVVDTKVVVGDAPAVASVSPIGAPLAHR
ncbi:MAG: RDD family protein [Deltaproteobacteria bacterium]